MKKFLFILVSVLCVLSAGCTVQTPPADGTASDSVGTTEAAAAVFDAAGYSLVRADNVKDDEQQIYMAFRDAMAEVTGAKLTAVSDFLKAYPITEKEIVWGKTGRDELQETESPLAAGDGWTITLAAQRIYFRWETAAAQREGAAHLLTLFSDSLDLQKGRTIIMNTWMARGAIKGVTAVNGGYVLAPLADTYIRGGSSDAGNFGGESTLDVKAIASASLTRKALLRFSLTEIDMNAAHSVKLRLYATAADTTALAGITVRACLYEDNWEEMKATYLNTGKAGKELASAMATAHAWCTLDLTDAVREAVQAGKTEISLMLCGDTSEEVLVRFSSKEAGSFAPELRVITDPDAETPLVPTTVIGVVDDVWAYAQNIVNEYLPWREQQNAPASAAAERQWDDAAQFPLRSQAGKTGATPTVYNSRTPATVPDYEEDAPQPTRSEYGGRTDIQLEATGYFRIEKNTDGTFTMVDPLGHPYIAASMGYVCPGTSDGQKAVTHSLFGSEEGWAKEAADTLKNELGFTAVTHLSRPDLLNETENKLPYAHTSSFLSSYARGVGAASAGAGHHNFADNATMPVFDPAFVTHCDTTAKSLAAQYGSDPYFLGYMSDNELPISFLMLDNSLSLLPENQRSVYTYAVAWTWLRTVTGKADADESDITDELRGLYCEFVYDRYFRVVTEAIRRYDENHLYLGCRFMYPGYLRECFLKAAGRWCDVVTMNYYFVWEPESTLMTDWVQWSGKPFFITEFYLKGADSGLANTAGAGRTGKTQSDRADYYSTYTMRLLESGWCVGWSWLQYWDNDPNNPKADPTSTNANKGIYNSAFEPYTVLTERMQAVNSRMYTLADYFAARRGG
ncbi:MAG: DNRLRE domain-containing protein [Ruminococcaceae bacterium]|nr:DNRLRE domain-containing protein [Oscillospiraceae bacterium]